MPIMGLDDGPVHESYAIYNYAYHFCRCNPDYEIAIPGSTAYADTLHIYARSCTDGSGETGDPYTTKWRGAVWDENGNVIGQTNLLTITDSTLQWRTFTFESPKPTLTSGATEWWIGFAVYTVGAGGYTAECGMNRYYDGPNWYVGGYEETHYWVGGDIGNFSPPAGSNVYWRYDMYVTYEFSPITCDIDELNDIDYNGNDVDEFNDINVLANDIDQINDISA